MRTNGALRLDAVEMAFPETHGPGNIDFTAHSERARAACGKKPNMSVLLVEDNPGDTRLIREMFAEQGYLDKFLTHAETMRDAESCLRNCSFDIVLLDLGLPDANGLEAVRRTRSAAPHIPIVVLTGTDDEDLASRTLQEGAQDYLIKGQIEKSGLGRALRHAIERNNMEEALHDEKERAQVTLNSIADAVACADIDGKVTYLNLVAETLTGWTLGEARGRPITDVFRLLSAGGGDAMAGLAAIRLEEVRFVSLPANAVLVRRDGFEIPIEDSVAPIRDREGSVAGSVIVFRDVSVARAMSLQMTHSAEHDFLTGLPNRLLLNDRIKQGLALARRQGKRAAVLFLDIDGFKHINDSLGHSMGDRLLQSISMRLLDCVRETDTVSRQGGDEFVILLTDVERSEDAAALAKRMLEAVARVHTIGQDDLHVTTSIGVSVYPEDGLDAETLIKNADTALYQAKENGRQGFQFFMPAMNVRAVQRQSTEESLRRALERQELSLHYQPKVDLISGEITGAEALVRWKHPTRGLVSPAEFIPIAEECGLILPIGNWVLREACRQTQEWADAGLPRLSMAVNISAVEFRHEGFLSGVLAILEESGLDPSAIELELTESVLMTHAKSTTSILEALRARGLRLAIDDFGTGYSSLSYLGTFPVDTLKIDQSFVRNLTASRSSMSIVTAIINMGRSLNLQVIAEGVETFEELAYLKAQQCAQGQGYYFSRPVPASLFASLLENGVRQPAGQLLSGSESAVSSQIFFQRQAAQGAVRLATGSTG